MFERLVDFARTRPRSPMAETEDLKSFQCRFESDRGHHETLLQGKSYLYSHLAIICIVDFPFALKVADPGVDYCAP